MIDRKVVLGITQGDTNGIGYEILLRSLADARFLEMFTPVIYGSGRAAGYYKKVLGLEMPSINVVPSAAHADPHKVNLVESLPRSPIVEMGRPSNASGEEAHASLTQFFKDWSEQYVDGLVTMPVNKATMQSPSFSFPGHTEYLAAQTGSSDALMLMISENLRLGVLTGHIPIAEVPKQITEARILEKLKLLTATLQRDFLIERPKIALLGLNPHAGEGGLLGDEELSTIEPAVKEANRLGLVAVGPYPADGFFGTGQWTDFDAVLAMYHDQGLTPFKTIAFERGVNFTAGLPLVRTSPAHGTAYGLVGQRAASCEPFRQAVYLAIEVVKNRMQHDAIAANALTPKSRDEKTNR